eukprot:SAG31_NODE_978_length_10615_cov_4.488208_1_plen_207_part_00
MLGALTQGDRRAVGSANCVQALNIETMEAKKALAAFYTMLLSKQRPSGLGLPADCSNEQHFDQRLEAAKRMLVHVGAMKQKPMGGIEAKASMKTFLNRLLGVPIVLQNWVFALLASLIELTVQQARRAGTLTLGCLQIGGDGRRCRVAQSTVIRPGRGHREARHVTVELDRGMSLDTAEAVLAAARTDDASRDEYDGFYMSRYGAV